MKISITGYQNDIKDTMAKNLFVTLKSMKHSVNYTNSIPIFDVQNRIGKYLSQFLIKSPIIEKIRSEYIANKVINLNPDIFFSVWMWLMPESIKKIRDAGIMTILLFPDPIINLGRQYHVLAPYDLIFFKDPYVVNLFREKNKLPIYYLPEACNPIWHNSIKLSSIEMEKYSCDITIAGNIYPYRTRLLEIFNNYDFKIWGPNWPNWIDSPLKKHFMFHPVYEYEKAKAFIAAKIVLNPMHFGELEGVNVRTFEIAGCGGFQIADWKPSLSSLFEIDKEIVTFKNQDELKEKVDYYLKYPEKRIEISKLGQIRALNDHTYEKRIEEIFKIIFQR